MMLSQYSVGDFVLCDSILDPEVFLEDPVYSKPEHPDNHFGRVYDPDVKLCGRENFLRAINAGGIRYFEETGNRVCVLDCFRPIDAQHLMNELRPDLPPTMLARPGGGGHCRGVAIDIAPLGDNGLIDMGTRFDDFSQRGQTRARRDCKFVNDPSHKRDAILFERARFDRCMQGEFNVKGNSIEVIGLAFEWWDFRIPNSLSVDIEASLDEDLPEDMRMMRSQTERQR